MSDSFLINEWMPERKTGFIVWMEIYVTSNMHVKSNQLGDNTRRRKQTKGNFPDGEGAIRADGGEAMIIK